MSYYKKVGKYLKNVLALGLVLIVGLMLTSCGGSSSGALENPNEVYATSGNYTITKNELFNEMKKSGHSYIEQRIEEVVLKDYIETVKNANYDDVLVRGYYNVEADDANQDIKKAATRTKKQLLDKEVLNAIFSTSDLEEIEKKTDLEKYQAIAKYVDNLDGIDHEKFSSVTFGVVYSYVQGLIADENAAVVDAMAAAYENCFTGVAKVLYASEQLDKEIKDESGKADADEEDWYFTKEDIINYNTSNYDPKGNATAIIIRFYNSDEATQTLKNFGLKAYKNQWYFIPEQTTYKIGSTTYTTYDTYYDALTINPSDPNFASDQKALELDDATILKVFIELYNYIYPYREQLSNVTTYAATALEDTSETRRKTVKLIYDAHKESETEIKADYDTVKALLALEGEPTERTTWAYEDITKISSSSLSSYVYDTMKTPDEVEDGSYSYVQYTSSAAGYGDFYYLVFKINANETEMSFNDPDDKDEYNPAEEAKEFVETRKKEIVGKLYFDKLTDDYVSNKLTSLVNDTKVKIHDDYLELLYLTEHSTYAKNKNKKANLIATITVDKKDTDITCQELYDFLEKQIGPAQAVTLLLKKMAKDTDAYKSITKEQKEQYKETIEYMTLMFSNGYYASYGYDPSIGKANFMKLYYGSSDIDWIIDEFYCVSSAISKLTYDFSDELISIFQTYANKALANFYSMSANGLVIYLDMDEDGVADSDWDVSEAPANSTETYAEICQNLYEEIIETINAETVAPTETIEKIISDFNKSSRYETAAHKAHPDTINDKWYKYKQYGLYLTCKDDVKFTNTDTISDEDLYNFVKTLYLDDTTTINGENNTFPTCLVSDSLQMTDDSYILYVFTTRDEATNFEYKLEDHDDEKIGETDGIYSNLTFLFNENVITSISAYNDAKEISANQIKAYLYEHVSDSESKMIPEALVTAITAYFEPVYTKYSSNANMTINYYELLTSSSGAVTFGANDAANQTKFKSFLDKNIRSLDGYYISNTTLNSLLACADAASMDTFYNTNNMECAENFQTAEGSFWHALHPNLY